MACWQWAKGARSQEERRSCDCDEFRIVSESAETLVDFLVNSISWAARVSIPAPRDWVTVTSAWTENCPTLSAWLEGAAPGHPLLSLSSSHPYFGRFVPSLEEILSTLEAASPNYLSKRRTSFRRNVARFADTRAELNVGYRLARGGVSFDFGEEGSNARSRPDIECDFAGHRAWIEVTSKSPEGVHALHDDLERELAEFGVDITLHVPAVLSIAPDARLRSIEVLRRACSGLSNGAMSVNLADLGGRAVLTAPSLMGGCQVTWSHDFASEILQAEAIFAQGVASKSSRARRGDWPPDTLLVIDASRLGQSTWLRPDSTWAPRLSQLDFKWDSLPFIGVAIIFSSLDVPGFRGAAAARPGLTTAQALLLECLATSLGLVI